MRPELERAREARGCRRDGDRIGRACGGCIVAACVSLACDRSSAPLAAQHPSPDEPWFTEEAQESGVDFKHVSGLEQRWWLPEIIGGGCALFDCDGDGDLDLYLVQGGDLDPRGRAVPDNRLYANRGDGTFEDVTARSGTGDARYGMGCAVGDYDRDGDLDLYVTNLGPNVLYENDGHGRFADVTERARVGDPSWSTSAAFVDIDADGWLDLFVVDYIDWAPERERRCLQASRDERDYCHPASYRAPHPATLYRNRGDGTFDDLTEAAGLKAAFGNGLGIACADFDGDGRTDIFVANDMGANQLWMNAGDGRFTDRALLLGCALSGFGGAQSGMGVQAVDIENDGDWDLFMTNLRRQSNILYLNEHGSFRDATARFGLSAPSLPFTGFGLAFEDFDNDGDLDLFVANGHVIVEEPIADPDDPYAQENLLMEQRANGRFAPVTPRGGVDPPLLSTSRGAAFGDIDGDGDIDIVVMNKDGPCHLLRNRIGSRGRWIAFRVLETYGSDAIGARVGITAAGKRQWRRVDPAWSYASSNDPRVHFGLGAASAADDVVVIWPDGSEQHLGSFAAGRVHELRR